MFKKNKKGISPLIATVLIIGFTIVLAALVITWGTKLFKSTVSETETTSRFNLACTTGLRLEATPDTTTRTNTVINVSLRNNNQDRSVNSFQFILYDSDNKIQRINNASTSGSNVFAVFSSGAFSATDSDLRLDFPVPKIYRLTVGSSTVNVTRLTKIEVYPIFTIEGSTKACESPVEVNLI